MEWTYPIGLFVSMLVSQWGITFTNPPADESEKEGRYAAAVLVAFLWPVCIWFQLPMAIIKTLDWATKK